MLYSKMLIPTLRETPKDAEINSHILMLRAGFLRKMGAGLYTFLPLGLKVILKIISIVREELNLAGAQELMQPVLIPSELWKESGRYDVYGKEMARVIDRHDNELVISPTAEEAFTAIVRENVHSYRDLPLNLYQINTKFRDEIRPRFGIMRCREFIMMDAYSFDINNAGLDKNYEAMRSAYRRIFKRCGLDVVPVLADAGAMGGSVSEEFMVPSKIGEGEIVKCPSCGYVANVERATAFYDYKKVGVEFKSIKEIATPNIKTIEELTSYFNTTPDKFLKSIIYKADGKPVMAVIRGDLTINETKLKNALKCNELELADENTIYKVTGAPVGFASPVGLKDIFVIADVSVSFIENGITGANKKDFHIENVNINRDFKADIITDIRNVISGDFCPDCKKSLLEVFRGIEVGHVFKLEYKYTKSMDVKILDQDGKEFYPIMGTYGIGVGRTMASVIEQNHDSNGIIWPLSIAPFQILVVPVNIQDVEIMETAQDLYNELKKVYEVLIDDRDERPGVKFKDADLIGIPIRITVGKSLKEEGKIEIKERNKTDKELVDLKNIYQRIREIYENKMADFII